MPEALELLREGRHHELWSKCCGFLDLDLEQFMVIQRRLLLEQLGLLADCALGRKLMPQGLPYSVEEFRQSVPITSYADYAAYLLEQREDALPEKPLYWQRTTGRSGIYRCKWIPVTERMYRQQGEVFLALLLLSSCSRRGEVVFEEHDKILCGLAPAPYTSGFWTRSLANESIFDFLPPLEEAVEMDFQERIKRGFELAITDGMDVFFGIASVLVAVGESFGRQGGGGSAARFLSQPTVLFRLVKALLKSKLAGRTILPKDIWSLKGLATGGGDASVYKEKVKQMWGRYPLEVLGSSEGNVMAMQTWNYKGMTFLPQMNFLEFIPVTELPKTAADRQYQPKTLLLDEVRTEELYELVITNFLGGAFVRYRTGDVIKITALRDDETNVNLPQMVFYSRADNVIELAGFTALTENMIWRAIENSGVPYREWAVVKEVVDKPILHLYVELKTEASDGKEHMLDAVRAELRKLDTGYADAEDMLGYVPIDLTILPTGSFALYAAKQQAAGADLAQLKPPRINPPDAVLDTLLAFARAS